VGRGEKRGGGPHDCERGPVLDVGNMQELTEKKGGGQKSGTKGEEKRGRKTGVDSEGLERKGGKGRGWKEAFPGKERKGFARGRSFKNKKKLRTRRKRNEAKSTFFENLQKKIKKSWKGKKEERKKIEKGGESGPPTRGGWC